MFKEIDINQKYKCPQCSIEDYPNLVKKGVHDRVECRHCNKYYKFLSKEDKYGTKEQQVLIWNKTLGKCGYCGCNINPNEDRSYHYDHIQPQINNGSNEQSNLILSCQICNTQKGKKSISEYRIYLKQKLEKATWIFFYEILDYSFYGEKLILHYENYKKLNNTTEK